MDYLDDLPQRDRNKTIERKAEIAFETLIAGSEVFDVQPKDRNDYGSDCQIEVIDDGRATNIRLHVQIKGTEAQTNSDGSISISVSRANLSYLIQHRHSFYVCYHLPSARLLHRMVDSVLREYERRGQEWTDQGTVTIRFVEDLTTDKLITLAALAKSHSTYDRNRRVEQTTAPLEHISDIIGRASADVYVPADPDLALQILVKLSGGHQDHAISANFDKFASVLGVTHDAMGLAYMAEINCGMAGECGNSDRIRDGIAHLSNLLETGRFVDASLYYCIGNGFSVLREDEAALKNFRIALDMMDGGQDAGCLPQCLKNAGSSYERLGDEVRAVEHYSAALKHDPHLAEAHAALGRHYQRTEQYQKALEHYDAVAFTENSLGKTSQVAGWRVNVLFNLKDGKAAFREISSLLAEAAKEPWIWPWCIGQVNSFGRQSAENARLAVIFWQRMLLQFPESTDGKRELLLAKLYLHNNGDDRGEAYPEFKSEFETLIDHVTEESKAFLWDRLGHWAQKNEDWPEAEACFRRAYDLEGGDYGYCLGIALNELDRFQESLPLFIEQAERFQPDDMSWFQVGVAYERLDRHPESIQSYKKALDLNPGNELAWFNLGGVYFNNGDFPNASATWKKAVAMFPDHQLAETLRTEFPFSHLISRPDLLDGDE